MLLLTGLGSGWRVDLPAGRSELNSTEQLQRCHLPATNTNKTTKVSLQDECRSSSTLFKHGNMGVAGGTLRVKQFLVQKGCRWLSETRRSYFIFCWGSSSVAQSWRCGLGELVSLDAGRANRSESKVRSPLHCDIILISYLQTYLSAWPYYLLFLSSAVAISKKEKRCIQFLLSSSPTFH